MLRLASRKPKKDTPVRADTTVQDFQIWTSTHICVVKDLVDLQYKQYLQVSIFSMFVCIAVVYYYDAQISLLWDMRTVRCVTVVSMDYDYTNDGSCDIQ